ncbi:MAG: hypothetical protein GY869_15995 [Planctomycetes bacterium]|nr:hypothetical protein [Planctomycetota bacterium]
MNLKNQNDRKNVYSMVFLMLALCLTVGAAFQVLKIAGANSKNAAFNDEVLAKIMPDDEKTQETLQEYKKSARDIAENNMFIPKSDESNPPGDCTAIFGDEARIGNRWYRAGDLVGDARIESIGPTVVTLLFEEKLITRKPVMVAENNSRNSRSRSQNTRGNQRGRGNQGGRGNRSSNTRAQSVNIDTERAQEIADRVKAFTESGAADRMSAFMGDNGRAMITEFMNASPEQRVEQINQFRQQFQGGNFQFRTSTGGGTQEQTLIIRQD